MSSNRSQFLIEKRKRRIRASLRGVVVAILALAACIFALAWWSANVGAQTPVSLDPSSAPLCLYHPWTVAHVNPLNRPVIVQSRALGYVRAVDAGQHIASLEGTTDPFLLQDMYSATIQYSIAGAPILGGMQVQNWLGDRAAHPNLTLGEAVRRFLMSGNIQQRQYYGYVLKLVMTSSENDYCNPNRRL